MEKQFVYEIRYGGVGCETIRDISKAKYYPTDMQILKDMSLYRVLKQLGLSKEEFLEKGYKKRVIEYKGFY